jgi:Spy/CpxP family protein refolding chaperone
VKALRGALLTIVLAALAAGVGAWGGARYVLGRESEPSLHAFVHDELRLTAEQDRRLQAIERDFSVTRAAREAELRMANAELAAAIDAKHKYSPEVRAAVEHFHDVMGQLQKETIIHVMHMRAILTPEQAAKFDKRVSEALTEDDE